MCVCVCGGGRGVTTPYFSWAKKNGIIMSSKIFLLLAITVELVIITLKVAGF